MIALSAAELSVQVGDVMLLKPLSVEIPSGEFVSILGPNGSGKSTLLKVWLGLLAPSKGRASALAGVEIAYVPQLKTMDRSFPGLAIELVATGLLGRWPWRLKPATREAALKALEAVDAASLADRQISALSGGELQRVYLARALAQSPDILFLDEPATGVDIGGEQDLYRLLERQRQQHPNLTIVMVTHDWGTALHHSSSILVLGRSLRWFGKPSDPAMDQALADAFGHKGHGHSMVGKVHEHGEGCTHA
ncbi:MAG: metal ABC transporter ATP-binding protein [Planctomycetes bacterium]|nr:metal ABC transporter ATP-binding protein [Planctomycetota bacterium]